MRALGGVAVTCVGSLALGGGTAYARAVGNGTARSCTSAAVVAAVRAGGHVRFACGPKPVTITLRATAKVLNTRREVVLDGGGRVTLSGGGKRRILYMNTCDPAQTFTSSHCQDQAGPRLTVQDITFERGNASGERVDGGGGGAIYNDGNHFALKLTDSRLRDNQAREGGGAIFFVSNDRTGALTIAGSRLEGNPSKGFETHGLPGIFFLGAGKPAITNSILR